MIMTDHQRRQCQVLEMTLNRALAQVRNVTNANKPINQLPVELLRQIFRYVPSKNDIRKGSYLHWPSDYLPTEQLIPLTHVCHYWRDVALGDPCLWTSVTLSRGTDLYRSLGLLAPERISRAGHLPVSLFVNYDYESAQVTTLSQIAGAIPLRELHVRSTGTGIYHLEWVSTLLTFPLDHLQYLTIHGEGVAWDEPPPPGTTYNIHASHLLRLTIIHVNSFQLLHFDSPSLTSLLISIPTDSSHWNMSDLLQMLEMTPCLEELILLLPRHAVFDRSQATPPSPSARLSLPHLRKFALHAETTPHKDHNGNF